MSDFPPPEPIEQPAAPSAQASAGSLMADGAAAGSAALAANPKPADAGAGHPGYLAPVGAFGTKPARSLLAMAVHETFQKTGARIGAIWVTILALVAVLAPFLANSRPYLIKTSDGWSSPLLKGLNWVDVSLLGALLGVLALLVVRRRLNVSFGQAALGLALLIGLAALTGALVTDPPLNEIPHTWRAAQSSGEILEVYNAPIPFGPNDRLRDLGDARVVPPWWSISLKNGLHNIGIADPPSQNAIDAVNRLPTRHWLGTTALGEDMASRMIYATRIALAIGFVATGIATIIGVTYGAIMGYFGGIIDLLAMRFIEIVQAVPRLILLLIVTVFFGKNIWYMMITIGLVSWTSDARFIRAEFLRLRGQDFVQAARAAGLPLVNVLFRHMLPNGVAPVLVNASFGVATAILLESVLSFLGLGLEATDPSWGQLLNQARTGGTGFNWWIATFPGLAIFLTVFAYILIGEAMRDAIDPKLKKAGD